VVAAAAAATLLVEAARKTLRCESLDGSHAIASLLVCALCVLLSLMHTDRVTIDMNDEAPKMVVAAVGIAVALLVALHRIGKGYHHSWDSILGVCLGMSVGMFVYRLLPSDGGAGAAQSSTSLIVYDPDREGPTDVAARLVVASVSAVFFAYFVLVELGCVKECTFDKMKHQIH
jgi:hypothetical protein